MSEALTKVEENELSSPYERDEPEQVQWRSSTLGDNLPDVGSLSLNKRGELRAVGNAIGDSYRSTVNFYKKLLLELKPDDPERENLTPEKIHEKATFSAPIEHHLKGRIEDLSWYELQDIVERDRDDAAVVWQTLKSHVREDLACGSLAANALESNRTPYKRATYSVVFEGFLEAWKPRDVIEQSMVEMLVQAYLSYNHWLGVAMQATEYSYNVIEQNAKEAKWNPPRLSADQTIENAMMMADRFNRLFLRVLRQMRDLRRYTPAVIVNNQGGQVNVATDGGQQVNMQNKKQSKKRAKIQDGSARIIEDSQQAVSAVVGQ